MRFLPTRVHGIIDYVVGVFLIFVPYLFGFADGTAAQWIPMLLGASAILYSLLTRYELGLFRLIPMPAHLGLDALSGLFFIISPWLFGFADRVFWPHVILGLFEVVASLVTRTAPERTR
ncbi:SPW repeat protein [Phytohalomonas tamaricis]|uniref:SPW repeat protein n=1 Tax=Phytohalomonas tamaricis TaxID=2081032 RepID=UPI000D0BB3BA|nr:SPW repeat protein [Phytohalomonas tamaricis]